MADTYYRLVGSDNPTDGTTSVVLERDEDGNVTKEATAAGSALSAEDKEKVESLGYTLEQVSKEDAEQAAASQAGSDVAGAAPTFDEPKAPAAKSGKSHDDK